jgi:hypothetical protein
MGRARGFEIRLTLGKIIYRSEGERDCNPEFVFFYT